MRLLELHLDRFGCFTDRRLRFRSDAALTVIYGANEAGKSTALAGLADVLYGIEARSPFDFLHRYSDMRLGAVIAGEDGRRLEFRRRKGNQNTLLDASEAPLPEDALSSFLGSVDRALFLDAFGLDRDRLRAGAKRLIEGGGRVGETLLAAAPGLSSLIALRQELAAEADRLFPASGRKSASRPFWQATDRHADARKRVRQESLQADTVREAHAARKGAAQAVSLLRQERRRLREEFSRLGRLKNALPRLRRIDRLKADRAVLGTLPDVAGDVPARCRAALESRRTLALEAQRLDREIAEAKSRLAALSVDDALLKSAEAVERLADQRAAILKATEDRPKRDAELTVLRQQADEHARRLGLPDRDALLARRPPDAAVARARTLLGQRSQLRRQREERREALAKVMAEIEDLARRREALGHVADPAPLRRQLEAFAGLPERMAARDETARTLGQREADLGDRLQRLVVPVTSVNDLARLAVPDAGSVEQASERFDALEKRRMEIETERRRLAGQLATVERRIGDLVAEADVPMPDALGEARIARDSLWRGLRTQLLGEPLPAPSPESIVEYEQAVMRADALADRLQTEADRIADYRKLESDRREITDETAANERALADLEVKIRQAHADWASLWSPAQLSPKPPREMRGWLQARSEILHLLGDLRAERARFHDAEQRLEAAVERLRKLAHGIGIEEASPADLLRAASAAAAAMEATFQDARLIAQDRQGCERRQRELEAALQDLDRRESEWRNLWSEAADVIGLREDAVDEEAEAALNTWQAVPALEASLKDLEHRVDRMQQDWVAFEDAAASLCAAVAPDLAEAPSLSASAMLRGRLNEAREAAARRGDLHATLVTLEAKAGELRRHRALNDGELSELCAAAGVDDHAELGAVAGRIDQGREVASQLAHERRALLEGADGLGEAELRAELADYDPDSLSARLQELADRQEVLQERLDGAVRTETRAEADLEEIEASAGAAAAAQEEQNALAEISDIIETWTGLVAAERLLAATIEAYRAQHQNPLLERASQAFAVATGNGFSGISLDYGDSDAHRIVAVRADGSRLAIDALSEGTADQLFLALRIATIEDHARRTTPLPFIADDLFVTFDDTRTKAGLTLLAELGRTTQTIVFTHHQHVVEAARHVLGPEVETIDLG